MSAASPLPNASPLAVPPPSISDPPPVTSPPSSQPNAGAPPPATPTAPPPSTQSPPPAAAPPPPAAIPPSATQSSPPPPIQPTSSPPLPPPPSSSPPPPTPASDPPISSPPPPFIPQPSPPTDPPPSPPTDPPPSPPTNPPPSPPPPPALEPPTSSPPPPESSPTPPSANPPPPPQSEQPQTSPPPPGKSPPITSPPPPPPPHPHKPPPPSSPSVNPPPPPEPITPSKSKSPPSPDPTPPSQPSPSPTNSSTNSSVPTVIPLAPPLPSAIPPPSSTLAPGTPENSNSTRNGGMNAAVAAGIGASLGIIALSLFIWIIWCLIKRKKEASLNGRYIKPSPYGSSPKSDSISKVNSSAPLIQSGSASDFVYSSREPGGGLGHSRSWFAYEELVVATNGFSPDNLLGEGGFGYVYKGYLPDGRIIAVKQLKIGGGQGEREFKAEVELISRIHHRHLVSLVGYCMADSRRLLVYEYVPNNTLYFHLHGEGCPPMIWATRVKVAAGAARGLAYLHEDCHPRIIHRDIKSSNILLNNNFDARVSDFGLAKLALDANSHVTTRVMGTFGYMAPEYASSGKLTEKSDVYSFGVVLLELITGRKPVDASQPSGDESLVEWARPLLADAIKTAEFGALVDPTLENNYVHVEMLRMIEAAAACVRHSASKRPRMGQVVRAFDSILASDITNGMQMGQSQVYNSAELSAEIKLFRKMAFGSQNYSIDFFSDNSEEVHDNTRRLNNERAHSDLHDETTHILERDLECDNKTSFSY
ncbi:hypothetical protein QQ045_020761 [Rhodiola kirilowii]